MALLGPIGSYSRDLGGRFARNSGHGRRFPVVENSLGECSGSARRIKTIRCRHRRSTRQAPCPACSLARPCHWTTHRLGIMPVIALVERDGTPIPARCLPIALDNSADRLVARLRSALRIRSLHATRTAARARERPEQANHRPCEICSPRVCCMSSGGMYPALSVALGERVGLIGAFSVETATRLCQCARYRRRGDRRWSGAARGRSAPPVGREIPRTFPWACSTTMPATKKKFPNLIRVEAAPVLAERSCVWCTHSRNSPVEIARQRRGH